MTEVGEGSFSLNQRDFTVSDMRQAVIHRQRELHPGNPRAKDGNARLNAPGFYIC